ncbi:FeoA family protein [Oribacterium sp. WCC10]|uniref:FeoA family protein n=1 Tax=Oribacterium sp. WCC10 TaxID=1855343 RepID=UPI0008E1B567|nr:FeoA family protein [Oribacterium sp. WCC10]SFG14046.1 ferrous iron transport protein A [Oribacterium sp. WCC10]
MLPLSMAGVGETHMINRVTGKEDMKQHLADLGFVPGEQVEIISDTGDGNVIVNIKETRLGITSQMASKIMVD